MKKLMIAAAVMACAAFVQAASFDWSTTANMTTSDGSTVATAMNPSGTLALVYLGNNASAIDWTTAEVVDTTTPSFTSSMGKTTSKTNKAFSFSMDDYGNGDIFGVVFKDAASGSLFYLQDKNGNMAPTYTIAGLDDDKAQLAGFDFATSEYWVSNAASAAVAPVPEPTSGLLLLLGVAGMALRRRRA